ncbi:MAG TPA: Gfo/Idh/MocA family oxidoreductase [Puia sp.]|uniref:Gfo/Idh/MocA family protein n=1 Tax=Puia sp. TaxID=2045100 RepID=UPI002CB37FCA|nr:Gfo/Idh/MocA family oxidoreductase [Puia sp.]HVU98417.1 Gfo/Idh/MocA family oxidoreductase [Puia sp.]
MDIPKKINWGIIGCGDVTEVKSGPAFKKVPNSDLVAVMRRDPAKAQDYARRHNVPRWYDNATDLINDPEVNAIYVATPPSSHEQYTLAAIDAGKPVYVEKPMAIDHAAALRMARAADEKKVKLVVAHYRREQPRFRKIKELLAGNAIGQPLLVRLEYAKPPMSKEQLSDQKANWRIVPSISGGGLFHDLGTHQLDLVTFLFGSVQKVTGVAVQQGQGYSADDMVAASLLFPSGVVFTGSWCFNAPHNRDYCEIIGTKGTIGFSVFSTDSITLHQVGNTTTIHTGNTTKTLHSGDTSKTLTFDPLLHVQQPMIEAVVRYFRGEGPNPDTGWEGAEIMRLMEAIVSPPDARCNTTGQTPPPAAV